MDCNTLEESVELVEENYQDYLDDSQENSNTSFIEYNSSRYHKSNLVNTLINKSAKLSNDRLTRVQVKVPSFSNTDITEEVNDYISITDSLVTVVKLKKIKFTVIVFLVIDRIHFKTELVNSISEANFQEAKFSGTVLTINDYEDNNLI